MMLQTANGSILEGTKINRGANQQDALAGNITKKPPFQLTGNIVGAIYHRLKLPDLINTQGKLNAAPNIHIVNDPRIKSILTSPTTR